MVILNQNVMIYIRTAHFQITAQVTSFRIFLQTRIMVDGAKFSSHESGGPFLKVDF